MKFCRQCGKTVAILSDKTLRLCPDCRDAQAPVAPVLDLPFDAELLRATFTVKEGKIHFLSQEGWLLWSGGVDQPHTLEHIASQASRILKIRKRKKK